MAAHACDRVECSGNPLKAPSSTWADAHGGVQRRRRIPFRPDSSSDRAAQSFSNIAFNPDIGDTLISAYGRLYVDEDPYIRSYGSEADASKPIRSEAVFPRSEPTGIVAHSGYIGILGRDASYLLDSNDLLNVAQVDIKATAHIISDDEWWLIGAEGIFRISIQDAMNGQVPQTLLSDDLDGILPPVLLKAGSIWLPCKDGRHFITSPGGEVRELPALPSGEEYFAAFVSNKRAAILSNKSDRSGGMVRVSEINDLISEVSFKEELSFTDTFAHTWCANDDVAYLIPASGNEIIRVRLDFLQHKMNSMSLWPKAAIRNTIFLSGERPRLLCATRDGEFHVLETDESGREFPWNSKWQPRTLHSWVVWGESIVAVVDGNRNGNPIRQIEIIPFEVENNS